MCSQERYGFTSIQGILKVVQAFRSRTCKSSALRGQSEVLRLQLREIQKLSRIHCPRKKKSLSNSTPTNMLASSMESLRSTRVWIIFFRSVECVHLRFAVWCTERCSRVGLPTSNQQRSSLAGLTLMSGTRLLRPLVRHFLIRFAYR